MDYSILNEHKIVPVVVLKDLQETEPKLSALLRGGIKIAEITFRTACAEDAVRLASKKFPEMLVGAGTIINRKQCERAIAAGAKFIVSPGLSKEVCDVCLAHKVPYIPGVVTPTEIIAALDMGLTFLKFFPAGVFGGAKTLKAISAAFPDVVFMPTGGVNGENFIEFLKMPCVKAIGGSWMISANLTVAEIEQLSLAATNKMSEEC